MISKDDLLKLETRREIYNFVLDHPGLHMREIARKLNIPTSTLVYHLRYLEKKGLIVSKNDHRYARYFVKEQISMKDKEIFDLLRQNIPRKIIILLFSPIKGEEYKNKKSYQKSIEGLRKPPQFYSKKELINMTNYWKGPHAKLFHLHKHPTTLDFHLNKLLKVGLIEKTKVGKEVKYKIKDPEKIFDFCIIYNYELSEKTINIWLLWSKIFSKYNIDSIMDFAYKILPHPYHI